MSKIRMAIIGCGGMSNAHAGRFAQVLDRIQIVAAVDIVKERAQKVAELFPGARWTTHYRDVIDDCEAALVVLPHHLHYSTGMDLLTAQKHVLMEKPMANSEQECLDLIRASRQADRQLMTAYVMRYHPLVIKFRELLAAKTFGEVFQLSIWTEQATFLPKDHWCCRAAMVGGGQLFSHGCHYIDLMLWMMGRPVKGTHLGTNYGTEFMEWEGTSQVSVRFESGALGYHAGTWGSRGTRLGYSFHAHCTEGMLELNFLQGKLTLLRNEKPEENLLTGEAEAHHMCKPTELEMMHFVDCIENKKQPETDGPSSLQGLRVIWQLYEAERRNTVADLRGLGLDQVDATGKLRGA